MSPPITPISATRGNAVPSLCVFIDTETNSSKGMANGEVIETWRLGVGVALRRESGIWTRRECRRFAQSRDLWDWVHSMESYRRPVWVFAHNLGFDLTVSDFWGVVDSGRYSTRDLWPRPDYGMFSMPRKKREWIGSVVLTDPPTILSLRSSKGSLKLVDTCNYYFGPLEDLGKSIGLEQLPAPARHASDVELFERCERDATILERSVCGWIDEWHDLDSGNWKPTAAGLGYSSWRATLGKTKVIPDKSDKQIKFARAAYYGGQVEAYYKGSVWPHWRDMLDMFGWIQRGYDEAIKGPVYNLDVHALYPYVMRSNYYPRRFIGYTLGLSQEQFTERAKFQLPISIVRIASETDTYPVRVKEQYLHAVGEFTTILCGNELIGAVQRGHVSEVFETAWYEPADLFSAFVDLWLERRHRHKAQGDRAREMLDKLVMNSLSGKFAQRKVVWKDRPDLAPFVRFGVWDSFDADTQKLTKFRAIGGCVQEHTGTGEGRDSFPAISAFITANGRELMREYKVLCPPRSLLYMDTDSLMVLQPGFDALNAAGAILEGTAGKLQVKAKWPWLDIHGIKFYESPDGTTCPGLKKDSRIDGPFAWKQSRFQRLASILEQYTGPQVAVSDLPFTPVGNLGHRTLATDGWTLPPRVDTSFLPF